MQMTGEMFIPMITRETLGAADKWYFPEIQMLEGVSDVGGDEGGGGGRCAPRCLDFNFVMGESCGIVMEFLQLELLILRWTRNILQSV